MNDIEKAIENLKHIQTTEKQYGRLWNMCEVSIEALEKQIPKKVSKVTIPRGKHVYKCSECGRMYQSGFDVGIKHCDSCGQKLDWSVEE